MAKRITQFAELSNAELVAKLAETKEELFNLRFQIAIGQLNNNARINMLLRTNEIAAAEAHASAGTPGK